MKAINILLDKQTYLAGENVKGTLELLTAKATNIEDFSFSVYGEEATRIAFGKQTFSASNILFYKDLSLFLGSTSGCTYKDKILQVSIGKKEIPFEFNIPRNTLESYRGKNVNISYLVSAKQGKRRFLRHINERAPFNVINVSQKNTLHQRRIEKEDTINGTILKLESEKDSLFPGETLYGALSINNSGKKKPRSVEIILKSIEFAEGQEDQEIEIDTGFGISFSRKLKNKKGKMKKEKNEVVDKLRLTIDWDESESDRIPFEIELPTDIKKCFIGKFSSYSWMLEGIVNIPWARDLQIEMPIQIN